METEARGAKSDGTNEGSQTGGNQTRQDLPRNLRWARRFCSRRRSTLLPADDWIGSIVSTTKSRPGNMISGCLPALPIFYPFVVPTAHAMAATPPGFGQSERDSVLGLHPSTHISAYTVPMHLGSHLLLSARITQQGGKFLAAMAWPTRPRCFVLPHVRLGVLFWSSVLESIEGEAFVVCGTACVTTD